MVRIVAVVGMPGSGKSEAVKFFVEKGYYRVYFGDITFKEMKRLGIEVNAPNEQFAREKIRKDGGMDAYARLSMPEIEAGLKETRKVVVESMYSFEEYKLLKERFGKDFTVLALIASPTSRYARLEKRTVRPITKTECEHRDIAQIDNLHQAGPIAMADFVVVNEGTMADLADSMGTVLHRIDGGSA